MKVTFSFFGSINHWGDKDQTQQDMVEKISEYIVKFPCTPKIGMGVNLDSFIGFYNLNAEEKEVWSKYISNQKITICHIIANDGFLEVILRIH